MKKLLRTITGLVTILGAINWGLVALNQDLIRLLLGGVPNAVNITQMIIGVCGLIYAGIELSDNRLF